VIRRRTTGKPGCRVALAGRRLPRSMAGITGPAGARSISTRPLSRIDSWWYLRPILLCCIRRAP
jgi:hypothetical protein